MILRDLSIRLLSACGASPGFECDDRVAGPCPATRSSHSKLGGSWPAFLPPDHHTQNWEAPGPLSCRPIITLKIGRLLARFPAAKREAVPGILVGRDPVAIGIGKDEGAPERTIVGRRYDGGSRRCHFCMQLVDVIAVKPERYTRSRLRRLIQVHLCLAESKGNRVGIEGNSFGSVEARIDLQAQHLCVKRARNGEITHLQIEKIRSEKLRHSYTFLSKLRSCSLATPVCFRTNSLSYASDNSMAAAQRVFPLLKSRSGSPPRPCCLLRIRLSPGCAARPSPQKPALRASSWFSRSEIASLLHAFSCQIRQRRHARIAQTGRASGQARAAYGYVFVEAASRPAPAHAPAFRDPLEAPAVVL